MASPALEMSAKLKAHRRLQAIRKVVLATGTEPLEQRRRQDRGGSGRVDRGVRRPAAFTGIGDASGELRQVRMLGEGARREIEQP